MKLFVVAIVTLVSGPAQLSAPHADEVVRVGRGVTRAQCERDVKWWNGHIARVRAHDQSPDTGAAVCIPEPV